MTMTTTVRIEAAVPPIDLLTFVTGLVNPDGITVPPPRPSERDTGVDCLMNEIGIGLQALCWVKWAEMLPTGDWSDEPGSEANPPGAVEISFDTTYSYRGPGGASCEDLHHSLLIAVRDWLGERGIPADRAWWSAGEFNPTPHKRGWFNGPLSDLSTQTGDPTKYPLKVPA